ncbi:MAG: DUF6438 domain-containing protein [Catalinimonas sp.]
MTLRLLALIALLSFGACRSQKAGRPSYAGNAAQVPVLTIEKTPCFGTCPIYRASFYADGKLLYEGKQFVDREGTWEFVLPEALVRTWLDRAEEIDYLALLDKYPTNMTDVPSTITMVRMNDQNKRVVVEGTPPPALKAFQQDLHQEVMRIAKEEEGTAVADMKP